MCKCCRDLPKFELFVLISVVVKVLRLVFSIISVICFTRLFSYSFQLYTSPCNCFLSLSTKYFLMYVFRLPVQVPVIVSLFLIYSKKRIV